MSEAEKIDQLLEALRKVGVTIPDALPIALKTAEGSLQKFRLLDAQEERIECGAVIASAPERSYWCVANGSFSTVIDTRDAASEDDAIRIARTSALQAWYLDHRPLADAIHVNKITHDQFANWMKKAWVEEKKGIE